MAETSWANQTSVRRNAKSTIRRSSLRAHRGAVCRALPHLAVYQITVQSDIHCSSVSSSRRAIREVYQTIFEMASTSTSICIWFFMAKYDKKFSKNYFRLFRNETSNQL